MKRQMRTVIRTGETGRLKREEVRAVIIAIRDGLPMPKVTPISEAKPHPARSRARGR
ncbi:hypothetical protein [Longimicrobium sp.]|uniref:hypothetical protein n=1 Tax=Longimicrobium sp. TaxID=2029185 RepID=UPI002E30E451|nr:hypothetical protein [Longimicrobium sp.]HEX6041385.1 hypothetical protein [Longimicrobium sp.]